MGGGSWGKLCSSSSARVDRTAKGDDTRDDDVTPVAKHDDVEKNRKEDTAVGVAVVADNDKVAQIMVDMTNSINFARRHLRHLLPSMLRLVGKLPLWRRRGRLIMVTMVVIVRRSNAAVRCRKEWI